MKNTFESNLLESKEASMRKQWEVVLGSLRERAERDLLEVEPSLSYDEATNMVSVELLLRPIPSDLDIEYEGNIFEGKFRSDEWMSASPEKVASWQAEIKENYLKASRDIFVIAGRKALFQAAEAKKKLEAVPAKSISMNAKPTEVEVEEEEKFSQAA
jgi:hypothetical protein